MQNSCTAPENKSHLGAGASLLRIISLQLQDILCVSVAPKKVLSNYFNCRVTFVVLVKTVLFPKLVSTIVVDHYSA